VIPVAWRALSATGVDVTFEEFDLGGTRYLRDGEILSDATLDRLRSFDAILLGAVGAPDLPPGLIERGLLLKMRFALDLYINHRPFSGRAPGRDADHDLVVVRENTEGPYVGEGGVLRRDTPYEIATQGSVNTRMGVERCVRYAFELAQSRERHHVTLVHKTNVLNFAGDLWQRAFDAVGASYPEVCTSYQHIDAACIHLVQDPQRFDVIVTDNLFGDILTDLAGAVSGGIGQAASANLNPARTGPSMFEPVHGSAPDIAGTNTASPAAAILSAAMMLDFLGEPAAAQRLRSACHGVVEPSTTAFGDEVVARLNASP
jgi:3-isopropylmalate dehydrogenase